MSRFLTLGIAVLPALIGSYLMASDEPCAKCPKACCADASRTASASSHRSCEKAAAQVDDADCEAPHRPAVLLTPTTPPHGAGACNGHHAKLSLLPALDRAVCGAACRESTVRVQVCCQDEPPCETDASECCNNVRVTCMTCCEDECDEGAGGDCDEEIESFITQVLEAQMQYLDGMMRARLEHDRELLQARAEAESRLAKQQVQHAEEIFKLRTQHVLEMQEVKEVYWAAKVKSLESQHRQALEHERDMFAMRQKHAEELQSERIATLRAEVHALRNRVNLSDPERVAQMPDVVIQQSSSGRFLPVEMPIQIEDLASGRVHYAPVPHKPEHVVLNQPRDVVERIEFSTPPISTGQPTMWHDVECLRREVGRLRVLVEDMLCFAPEFPPNPVPQAPMGDCDN
jgi:hypothetical protein